MALQRALGNRRVRRLMLSPKVRRETIQRFAFVNETQVDKSASGLTAEMQAMVSDTLIRNYVSMDEFKKHAANQTDYLGNLAGTAKAGTWLRFNPAGINILGENHTLVTLSDVAPAVGTKNFIYEQFSADFLAGGSAMKAAYEQESAPAFKKFGIENEPDKQKFGAESLYPKMGFALTLALPYFRKTKPIADLKSGGYVGQPVQRYLRIAWGYCKDNALTVDLISLLGWSVPPAMAALAKVHKAVEAQLDPFIAALPVEGYLGDELDKPQNAGLFDPLAKFAAAFTNSMVALAAVDPTSRLSQAQRKKLSSGKGLDEAKKQKLFADWRNFKFEENVKQAAQRGVRYAGMGQAHLDYLKGVGLPANGHPYEMAGKDLQAFEDLTNKLKQKAKTP